MYLFIVIAVPIHWLTNDNKCWITVEQNKLLEISEDYKFRDFYAILTNTYPKTGSLIWYFDHSYTFFLFFAFISCIVMLIKKIN
tara:strand:- start:43 stop:294 length:252 start_codon:yes stop_codon:yes gene_type:complete